MGIEKLRLSRSKLRLEEFDKEAIAGFIVGLGLADADNILKGLDVSYRVVRDGRDHYVVTQDFDINRANLSLDNDVITSVRWG